jgi:hypothetical protein
MSRLNSMVIFMNLLCALTSIWGMAAVGEKNDISEFFYCTTLISIGCCLFVFIEEIFNKEGEK